MDYSKIQDPVVREYMRRKVEGDQAVKAAKDYRSDMALASGLGDIAEGFINKGSKSAPLYNRWQDMGKATQMVGPDPIDIDTSVFTKAGAFKLAEAEKNAQKGLSDFQDKLKIEDFAQNRADKQKEHAKKERMLDPTSEESIGARAYLKQIAPNATNMANFETLSATQIEKIAPSLYQAYNAAEQRKSQAADRAESREMRAALAGQVRADKAATEAAKTAEKMEQLRVGNLGYAQTSDDAKKLKDAVVSKANFDNKLGQLIKLREEFGGEVVNREAVARGNQLSKDLLLEYKNLQSLGVLSQSDEDIINKIIPSDPLEFRSPLAAAQGQDPILSNLKAFQADAEKDYQTKLQTRLRREGRNPPADTDLAPSAGVIHGSKLP